MKRLVRILAKLTMAAALAGLAWGVFAELAYLDRLPPVLQGRMPAHWRIPWFLPAELHAAMEDLYSPSWLARGEAAHRVGNFGPRAAGATPMLIALLADAAPPKGSSNNALPTMAAPRWHQRAWQWATDRLFPPQPPEKAADARGVTPPTTAMYALVDIGEPAIPALVAALRDPLPAVRARAARALALIGDARAVDPLVAMLASDDPQSREAAADALSRLGDGRAVEPLIAALATSPGPAMAALARLGDERAIGPILAAARRDPLMQSAAGQTLVDLGDKGVDALLSHIGSGRELNGEALMRCRLPLEKVCTPALVRDMLTYMWWDHVILPEAPTAGTAQAADLLFAAAGDPAVGGESRRAAACQLAQMGDPRAASLVQEGADLAIRTGETRMTSLMRPGSHDPSREAWEFLFAPTILGLGRLKTEESFQALCTVIRTGDTNLCGIALQAMQNWTDIRVAPLAVEHFTPGECRRYAVLALSSIGKPATVYVLPKLADPNVEVRAAAALALGELRDPRAALPLLDCLAHDKDAGARMTAAVALGKLRERRAVEPLIACLSDGNDEGLRVTAAHVLGELGAPQAIEPLLACVRTVPEAGFANQFLNALGRIKDARVVDALAAYLQGPRQRLDVEVAGMLDRLKDPRGKEYLYEACQAELAELGRAAGRPIDPYRDTLATSERLSKCFQSLMETRDPRAIPLWVFVRRQDPEFKDSPGSLSWLAPMGPEVTETLKRLLKIKDFPYVQAYAAGALLLIHDPEGDREAWATLAQFDWHIRSKLVREVSDSLAKNRDRIPELLEEFAAKDPDRCVRQTAIEYRLLWADAAETKKIIRHVEETDPSRMVRLYTNWLDAGTEREGRLFGFYDEETIPGEYRR